jgi:hypothetical protein
MNDSLPIIDAFLDGEVVDPAALKGVLRTDGGLDYLADVLALREVVTAEVTTMTGPMARRRPLRWIAAAAALGLAAAGGYAVADQTPQGPVIGAIEAEAPPPSRVIELTPGVNWTETPGGQ